MKRRSPKPKAALDPETAAAALTRITEDYSRFVIETPREETPPDPKAFAARQAAARSALAHIVELTDLTGRDAADDAPVDPAEVLAAARADIAEAAAQADIAEDDSA